LTFWKVTAALVLAVSLVLPARASTAPPLELRIIEHSLSDYIQTLLERAFEGAGQEVAITRAPATLSHGRMMLMVERQEGLDLFWRGEDAGLKERFLEVEVDLTAGLKGVRVMFVRPDDRELYANVHSLDDFRALGKIGAMGHDWNDVRIWEANGLPVDITREHWNPAIYNKLAAGRPGVDYFSRGIIEMAVEAPLFPDLAVEPHIQLVYRNDFRIYVSKDRPDLHERLTGVLAWAAAEGILEQTVREVFPDIFRPDGLNIEGRRVIPLAMPLP